MELMQNRTNDTLNATRESNQYENLLNNLDICIRQQMYHKDLTQITPISASIIGAYLLVIILAILGNSLVIWTVWRNTHMHTVTNYYIVNLAISDLLVACLVMPLKLMEYTADCQWQVFRSDALCSVVTYLLPIFVFASVLTLAAISMERYYAIVHPLSAMKINSKSRTRKIIAVTWIIPIIVACPFVFCRSYAFTIYSDYGSISRQICNDRFDEIDVAMYGNDPDKRGEFRKGYFLFLFCVIYLIPSIVILTTCIKIAISLLQPITVDNSMIGRKDTSRRHEENKRKVARMVMVIAITFIVSWSPQYLVSIVSQLQEHSFLRESNFLFTMLMTHLFGFANSCLNPVIYTAMSQKFRRSFKEIVRRIFFCCSFKTIVTHSPTSGRGSGHRFTSTLRHTLSDTEGHHIALNDSVCPSDSFYGNRVNNKTNSRSSSSGAESDVRSYKCLCGDKKIIKKYIFKNNGQVKSLEESSKPLIGSSVGSSPIIELKGILKCSQTDKRSDTSSENCSDCLQAANKSSRCSFKDNSSAAPSSEINNDKNNQNSISIVRDTSKNVRVLYNRS